jgi:hypothetical protein
MEDIPKVIYRPCMDLLSIMHPRKGYDGFFLYSSFKALMLFKWIDSRIYEQMMKQVTEKLVYENPFDSENYQEFKEYYGSEE